MASGLLSCVSPLSSRRELYSSSSTTACRASNKKKGLDLRADFACSYVTGSLHGSSSGTCLRTARDTIDQAIPRSSCRKGIVTMVVRSSGKKGFHHKPQSSLTRDLSRSKYLLKSGRKLSSSSFVCRLQDSQGSEWEREEARWLREEKRWVREEERWHREEARWAAERKDLLEQTALYREQIKALTLEKAKLESEIREEKSKDGTLSELITSLAMLLQSLSMATPLGREGQGLSVQTQISSSSSSSTEIRAPLGSMPLEKTIEMVTAVSQPSISELKAAPTVPSPSHDRNSRTLKRGAEGDDVKALQEALAKLGFYSGDADMEYSSFLSGTEKAVRSWQATLGALEDGIMTAELLKKLFGEETAIPSEKGSPSSSPQGKAAPSAKATAPTPTPGGKTPEANVKTSGLKLKTSGSPGPESATVKASFSNLKKPSSSDVETSRPRVYLLGENRWEEPDRLLSRNGPTAATTAATVLSERCYACKGQGNIMCTECEGTGELNVEEQFLEWADEGAKCPYCEGQGVLDCDVCDGKGVKAVS